MCDGLSLGSVENDSITFTGKGVIKFSISGMVSKHNYRLVDDILYYENLLGAEEKNTIIPLTETKMKLVSGDGTIFLMEK